MVDRFSKLRFRRANRDSGAQKRDPLLWWQKPRLFAIRNLYLVDFTMFRKNLIPDLRLEIRKAMAPADFVPEPPVPTRKL
jgi:hypothetical protein